jgi:hypothetical protein
MTAMPHNREQHLLQRRDQLVARSAQLRGELSSRAAQLAPQGLLAGGVQRASSWVQRHPEWVVGAAALLLVVRPQRAWRWGGRLLAAWQVILRARPLWQGIAGRRR